MKQTILSTKQSELLESLIVSYGRIVVLDQIYGKTKDSKETTRRSVVPSAGAKKPRKKASKNTKPTDEKKKK
jgi:hypothetical protein